MRLWLFLTAFLIATSSWAAEPQYEAFPAESGFFGRAAIPALATAQAKAFRTRLREGVTHSPNFNGHYSFIGWGCGSGCAEGAVVDQVTGAVSFLPFSMCCADSYYSMPDFDYFKFRRDSSLIILYGKREDNGPEGKFFYTFRNGQFRLITSVLAASSPKPGVSSTTPVCRELPSDAERLACYDRQSEH